MPETQSMPKPLMVEKIIGARMDLPFGLGSARKVQKWQEEQANAARRAAREIYSLRTSSRSS